VADQIVVQVDVHRSGQIGEILWPQFGDHIVAQIDYGRRFGHVQGHMGQMRIRTLDVLEVLQAEAVARATGLQDMVTASWYVCEVTLSFAPFMPFNFTH